MFDEPLYIRQLVSCNKNSQNYRRFIETNRDRKYTLGAKPFDTQFSQTIFTQLLRIQMHISFYR